MYYYVVILPNYFVAGGSILLKSSLRVLPVFLDVTIEVQGVVLEQMHRKID